MIQIEHFTFNSFYTNCFVVWDESLECAILDPGCSSEPELQKITGFISSKGLTPVCIMLTHCHFDHIYGMSALTKEYGIPVHADMQEMYTLQVTNPHVCNAYGLTLPEEYPLIKTSAEMHDGGRPAFVMDGDTITVGSLLFDVIATPGHSKGGLCFLERGEKVLFSGDTLFAGAIGRTDHPGGDYDQMMRNIFGKLMVLDGDVAVYPGHGPSTDIATERTTNPFLMPFNEPFED